MIAEDILQKWFGNMQEGYSSSLQRDMTLPPVTHTVDNLNIMDSIEKHSRSLEVVTESINHNIFVPMTTLKLHLGVLRHPDV